MLRMRGRPGYPRPGLSHAKPAQLDPPLIRGFSMTPRSSSPATANQPPEEAIVRQFGLEAIPASVLRLHELLRKRDAATEDFAKLVGCDSELKSRLLRAANPRAECEEDYAVTDVEEALQRTGMSIVLLLAMVDPLIAAVLRSFKTMLHIDLQPLPPTELDPFSGEHALGEVRFSGKATGLLHLRVPTDFLPLLGQRLLGLAPTDVDDPVTANDVMGELCNMIGGNFKSNLCDAGLQCKLSLPNIVRTEEFRLLVVEGGTAQRCGFRAPEVELFADLSVNPWDE